MMNLKKMASLILSSAVLLLTFPSAVAANDISVIYVSNTGSDLSNGTLSAPFATIEKAREYAISSEGDVRIEIMGGKYYIDKTLVLSEVDTKGKSITFSAYNGEKVEISNAKKLPKDGFKLLTDEHILSKMPHEADGNVYTFDIEEYGIKNYGDIQRVNMQSPDIPASATVVEDGIMTEPAAWPNYGAYTKIAETYSVPEGVWGYRFSLSDEECERVKRWGSSSDFYIYGFFNNEWADDTLKIASVNPDNLVLQTYKTSVYGMKKDKKIRFINLLEEMDMPGEFYIDRNNNVLYYYPVNDLSDVSLLYSEEPVIKLSGADNVTFSGLTISGSRTDGIVFENEANNNSVLECEFRNLGRRAITIDNSKENLVSDCHIHNIGNGGIKIIADSQYKKELINCNNVIRNSLIEDINVIGKRYKPGIGLYGIGDTVSGNTIRHTTHSAIDFGGNNNIIEKNDIYNVLMDSHDAGAIYSVCSWLNGGTVIRDNYIHDCKDGVAIYMDNFMSDVVIERNRIVNMNVGVSLQGGSYLTVKNNLLINIFNQNIDGGGIVSGMFWAWNENEYNRINSEVDKLYKNGTLSENIQNISNIRTQNGIDKLAKSVYDMQSDGYNMEKWYSAFPYLKTMISDGNAYSPKENIIMNNLMYTPQSSYTGDERKIRYEGISMPPKEISKSYAESTNLEIKTNTPPVQNLNVGDVTLTDESDLISTFDESVGNLVPLSEIGYLKERSSVAKLKLLSPENCYDEVAPADMVFAWSDNVDADSYIFEIASDRTFSDVLKVYETNEPYYRVNDDAGFSLVAGRKYFWRVTAKAKYQNPDDFSAVSNIREFTTCAFHIDNLEVYDSTGKKLNKFLDGKISVIEFNLENCSGENKKIKITAQPYTAMNVPIGETSQSEVYLKNFEVVSQGFGIIVPSDAEYVKIMIDDGVNMIPQELIVDYYSMNDFGISDMTLYDAYGRNLTDLMTQSANIAEFSVINRKQTKKVKVKAEAFLKSGASAGPIAQNEIIIKRNEKATVGLGLTTTPETEYIKISVEDILGNVLSEYIADYASLKPESNDKLSFRAVHLTDSNGTVTKKIIHGNKNNLNICVRNVTKNKLPLKITAAVYDENNRLERIFVKDSNLDAEETENAFFEMNIPVNENSYVKTFLWNAENNTPLTNVIEFN